MRKMPALMLAVAALLSALVGVKEAAIMYAIAAMLTYVGMTDDNSG